MIDYLNAIFSFLGNLWQMLLTLPIYGDMTVGYFIIAFAVFSVICVYFVFNLKGS